MVLRMACPTKRSGSDNWYFRRRIPADVQAILAKMPKDQRPRNWYANHISISLRTADRAKAKTKCPEVAAEVERQMLALREGPKPLSHKQIAALSGELYTAFAQGLEDNPVLTSAQWQRVADMNEEARRGAYGNGTLAALGINRSQGALRRASMEARFGKLTNAFLVRKGIVTDEESRWELIDKASIDLSEAAKKLARNADYDYSPDKKLELIPKFEDAGSEVARKGAFKALVEAWHVAALPRVRKRTAERFKRRVETFIAFLGCHSACNIDPLSRGIGVQN